MEKVVKILIERDGMSRSEAIELIKETQEMLLSANIFDAADIMANQLGLEPDYILDILLI